MKKLMKYIGIYCLLFSGYAIATESKDEIECKKIYPEICKSDNSCNEEERIHFEKMNNFCMEVIKPDNFLNNTIKKLLVMEERVLSSENPEALKREFPELREDVKKTEERIIEGVKLISKYAKDDPELPKRFNNKTSFLNKEVTISNSKGFLLFVMKDNNLISYRNFYNNKIKKDKGENSIADFKEQVLTKRECVNLMFHTLKTYKLNEGIDAIKEVTELLDKQNIKCK